MSGKILAPLDFSEISETVVRWATELARDCKRSLILLHVQAPSSSGLPDDGFNPFSDAENPELRKMLQEFIPKEKSIPCEHRVVLGIPSDQIVQIATDENVDLIVMGSHGRTGLKRLLMGSVAELVLRHAPCPVLVVKDSAQTLKRGQVAKSSPAIRTK